MAKSKSTPKPKSVKKSAVEMLTKNPKSSNKGFIAAIIISAIILLGYFNKDLFIVATVNNKPITRLSIVKELEKQGGSQVLEGLVTQMLIVQEAEGKGVDITQKNIDSEIKTLEDQFKERDQSLDEVLSLQGMTRDDLIEQTKVQLMLQELLMDDIKVTDDEIDAAYEENVENLPEGTSEKDAKSEIKESLESQKLNAAIQPWLEELREKASINYFKEY